MKINQCRLALSGCEINKLMNAHVFPSWVYDGNDTLSLYRFPDVAKVKKLQSNGIYDKNILCEKCDNALGRLDSVSKKVFCKINQLQIKRTEKYLRLPDIDKRNSIKAFILSLIWRASISSHMAFSETNLGCKYEKLSQELLMNELEPNNSYRIIDDINCFSTVLFYVTDMPTSDSNIYPSKIVIDEVLYYFLLFNNNIASLVKVDDRDLADEFKEIALSKHHDDFIGLISFEHIKKFFTLTK